MKLIATEAFKVFVSDSLEIPKNVVMTLEEDVGKLKITATVCWYISSYDLKKLKLVTKEV